MKTTMRYLSLFSGIEAATMAWRPLGWECAAVAEIEPFPCHVLKHHYPEIPNLGDITKITREQIESLGRIDVVVGGFPCQDLSIAGKRKGLKHADGTITRSGLFFTAMQIVQWAKPRWTVVENVPGLFSSNGGWDFNTVVGELAGAKPDLPGDGWRNAGMALGPEGLVEWCVLDAQFFGVPQRRRRVFFIRDSGNWRDRPPLLLERQSLSGDSPPRRQAGQRTAPTLSARTKGGGGLGTDFDCDGGLIPLVSPTLRAGGNKTGGDRPPGTDVDTCESLVPVRQGYDLTQAVDAARSLLSPRAGSGGGGRYDLETETMILEPSIHTLAIRGRGDQRNLEYRTDGTANAVLTPNGGRDGMGVGAVQTGMSVRRLTPRECERLQGFPDDSTKIPVKNKPAADGPRYKALGNSFAVPVVRWIGQRIQLVEDLAPINKSSLPSL